jgi:dihydrofolate synthase/folylpolyglutamate synthase
MHFWKRQVDAGVLEVGLGGRFDSTNVCQPNVALITSISLDHTQQLGHDVASIAQEKAGIIKPGRPTVSGATSAPARAVIERLAQVRGSRLYQLGVDFHYDYTPGRVTATDLSPPRVQVITSQRRWPWMDLGLLGEHQAANAAVALSCVERLREQGWHISDQAVVAGLAAVSWPARMEVVARRPLVVLDCAHNVASVEALVATLLTSFPSGRRWLLFAASSDKDLSGMLRVLAPHFTHAFLTRYAGSARGMPAEELAVHLRSVADLGHTICATAGEAWRAVRSQASPDDLICVTGSVFLAGELRPILLP